MTTKNIYLLTFSIAILTAYTTISPIEDPEIPNESCYSYEYISERFKVFIASINTTAIIEKLNGPGIFKTLMDELE